MQQRGSDNHTLHNTISNINGGVKN